MRFKSFDQAILDSISLVAMHGEEVDTGHWQGVPTEGHPDLVTLEVPDVAWSCPMPHDDPNAYCYLGTSVSKLVDEIRPNLPWADLEFEERVGRQARNPHESLDKWPWWKGQTEQTMYNGMFSHTYSERYWPKRARPKIGSGVSILGIRYEYGDLDDLVSLLLRQPYTRQAWLPIFFPEDTGAVHGGRIPCTLGYQFMVREEKLHMWYVIRSCDAVRHFRDDLYLSARLLLWVLQELTKKDQAWEDVTPGIFHFHCFSLHVHKGDLHLLR